jgi:hypothetical protein
LLLSAFPQFPRCYSFCSGASPPNITHGFRFSLPASRQKKKHPLLFPSFPDAGGATAPARGATPLLCPAAGCPRPWIGAADPAAASSPVAVSSRRSISGRRNPSRRRWSLAVRHHLLLLLPLMPPALGPLSITDTRWPACRLRQPADLRSLCSPIRANGGRSLPGVAVGATCTCCLPAPRRWAASAGAAYTAAQRHALCL